jgi:DNA invertase Pin-like site-specific DNA recombinase
MALNRSWFQPVQTAYIVDKPAAGVRHSYAVPREWVFQDEGYSGATLVRPGLEALRDLAAQGQTVAVLVYSPDRLSRKCAYHGLRQKSSPVMV